MFSRVAAIVLLAGPITAQATPACIGSESTWVWADCDAGYTGEGCECDCIVDDDDSYYSYTPGDLCEMWGELDEPTTTDTATAVDTVTSDTSDTAALPHECVYLRSDCTEWGGGGSYDSGIYVDEEDDDGNSLLQLVGCATGPAPLNPGIVLLFAAGLLLRRSRD